MVSGDVAAWLLIPWAVCVGWVGVVGWVAWRSRPRPGHAAGPARRPALPPLPPAPLGHVMWTCDVCGAIDVVPGGIDAGYDAVLDHLNAECTPAGARVRVVPRGGDQS